MGAMWHTYQLTATTLAVLIIIICHIGDASVMVVSSYDLSI